MYRQIFAHVMIYSLFRAVINDEIRYLQEVVIMNHMKNQINCKIRHRMT